MRGRNDEKGQCLKFVSPAKAGVQPKVFKRASLQFEDVYPIMDSSVTHQLITVLLRLAGVLKKFYTCLRVAASAKAGWNL
jgi:hypothetical protein